MNKRSLIKINQQIERCVFNVAFPLLFSLPFPKRPPKGSLYYTRKRGLIARLIFLTSSSCARNVSCRVLLLFDPQKRIRHENPRPRRRYIRINRYTSQEWISFPSYFSGKGEQEEKERENCRPHEAIARSGQKGRHWGREEALVPSAYRHRPHSNDTAFWPHKSNIRLGNPTFSDFPRKVSWAQSRIAPLIRIFTPACKEGHAVVHNKPLHFCGVILQWRIVWSICRLFCLDEDIGVDRHSS